MDCNFTTSRILRITSVLPKITRAMLDYLVYSVYQVDYGGVEVDYFGLQMDRIRL